jgi:small subunit ribosomal protein S5
MAEESQKSFKGKGGNKKFGSRRQEREFDQKIVDLARVTRVMAGGKRMRFRATVVIGDRKGKVAIGTAKGADVTIAINKAVTQAKKHFIQVPIVKETIPHEVNVKYKASKVMLKPARIGTGIKAGGVVRIILDIAGVPNIVGKILRGSNKINIARAVIQGLSDFKGDYNTPVVKKDNKATNEKRASQKFVKKEVKKAVVKTDSKK